MLWLSLLLMHLFFSSCASNALAFPSANDHIFNTMSWNNLQSHSLHHEGRELTYPYHVVSLNPLALSYGGIGNLLLGIMGIEALALASGKVAVINHAVIQALFNHPDTKHGQTHHILSNKRMNELFLKRDTKLFDNIVSNLHPCGQIAKLPLDIFSPMVYLHACYGAPLNHPNVKQLMSRVLNISHDNSHYSRRVGSAVLQWFTSNPTPLFQSLAMNHTNTILDHCGMKSVDEDDNNSRRVDLMIQIRNYVDLGGHLEMSCVENCIMERIKEAIDNKQQRLKQQQQHHQQQQEDICVYISSDDPDASDFVLKLISKKQELKHIVHVVSNSIFQHAPPPNSNNNNKISKNSMKPSTSNWHSGDILVTHRHEYDVATNLPTRYDLLDWFVIQQAQQALYSEGSTFSTSARQASGYQQQQHDYVFRNDDHCLCSKVFDLIV